MFNSNYKAEVLTQALPYIQEYKGKTIVVKYGGNAMISDDLRESVVKDIILLKCVGFNPILVHGGGPYISSFLEKLNIESKFLNGLRFTDSKTIEIVQMVLGGKVNKDLVSLFEKSGGKAIGLCGMDGSLLKAKKLNSNLGYVGEITSVNRDILDMVINSGLIPIVGSVALGEDDNCVYNINADTCAAKISSAINAEKLILLTDVPGVLANSSDKNSLISKIQLHEVPKLYADKIIKGGMIPKIDCCVEAVSLGVKRAHIIDGRIPHSILLELFSHEGIGTMIY